MSSSSTTLQRLSRAEIEAEQCRRNFALFVNMAWPVIEPGTPLLWNWHLDALCLHLQATFEGRITRLLINIAPGHAKSSVVSVMYPVWCWIHDPAVRWLCASHSLDLAIRDNKNRRDLIESEWFQERFGGLFRLSSSQNVKSFFENTSRGYMIATAVRSSATGKRGTHLLIDDPNNAMAGEADILAVKAWFGKTWMSRLNDQEHGSMVVVGQRLHENDLSGHILKLGGWTHLNLPEEFEPERKCVTYLSDQQPAKSDEPQTVEVPSTTRRRLKHKVVFVQGKVVNCSCEARLFNPNEPCKHMQKAKPPKLDLVPFWEDPRTEPGELLWPDKFPREVIDSLKRSLGSMNYAAQFQQSPVPAGGGQVKAEWLRYYEDDAHAYKLIVPGKGIVSIAKASCWSFATVDLAISSKQHADYTVIGFWAVTPHNDLILFDVVRGHFDNPEQQRIIESLHQRYQPYYIMIESVAYQLALIQQLLVRGVPVREYKPVRDKVSRFISAAIWYENGKIYHLRNAPWLADLEDELLKFPRASHDDQCDMVSMAAEQIITPHYPLQDDASGGDTSDGTPSTLTSDPLAVVTALSSLQQYEQPDPFAWADSHTGGGW